MYSIRGNGDSIAHEYNKLMGKSQNIVKKANISNETAPLLPVADSASAADGEVDAADDSVPVNDISDSMLSDMLVSDSAEDQIDDVSDLEGQISDMVDYAEDQDSQKLASNLSSDPVGQYIMNGLGKIAASLRSKGEGFAADVVEVTAFGIREDLVKEANRKNNLILSLNKMASDFNNSGDNFAADMVLATVNKISN
jgi:hypothetical protein